MSDVLDTNAAYISRSLQELGVELIYKVTVGDDLERITDALRIALARADVVLTTGGLADGPDELTTQAVATAVQIRIDPQKQTLVGVIQLGVVSSRNVGFIVEHAPGILVCLPGDRREMSYLLETEVLPYLQARINLQSGLRILRTAGVMESSLRQQLADLPLQPNQWIGFDSYAGQTNVRLRVVAESPAAVQAQLAQLQEEVSARLGDHVYGQNHDRLETVVLALLAKGDYALTIGECHTDQALAQAMREETAVPSPRVTFLPITHPAELAAAIGIAAPDAAVALSQWCRGAVEMMLRQTAVDLSLLIYNDIMPGGVQLSVYLASAQGVSVSQRSFGGHPEHIHQWASTLALTHLYRWLLTHV
ncbi:MAG: hypothetical protein IPM39_08585 [Chloroflexi bacterium]|nr:hypothetical protein [Chloroflexota bacterium]